MTLDQADQITRLVINLAADKSNSCLLKRSQLRGHSLVCISQAFSIRVAMRRLEARNDPALKVICFKYADQANALVNSLEMTVVSDGEYDAIARLDHGSQEAKLAKVRAIQTRLQERDAEKDELDRQESIHSFNAFCWSLDADDPLYWQKVHARLQLPVA